MNTKNSLIVIVVLIIVAVGAYLLLGSKSASAPVVETPVTGATSSSTQPASSNANTAAQAGASARTSTGTSTSPAAHAPVTITYGPNGFSPKSVSIPVGTQVTWVNQSGSRMWVASGVHPTHTVYDGTSTSQHCAAGAPTSSAVFDECATGNSFTFTFNKVGTWNFHNHANASDYGSVTVTAK